MKKSKYIFVFLLVAVVNLFAQVNKYEVESAIVEYEIVGSGESMGSKTTITGKSKLYFKDFGKVELSDEKIVQTVLNEKEEERFITKIVGDTVYTVDFNDEVVYSQKMISDEENIMQTVKNSESLIAMGAKKLGTETILTYKCDVWQLGEDKIWIYNSVPLKLVSQSLGITQVQEAKLAVFNVKIEESKFKLPAYPVKVVEDMTGMPNSETPELSPEQEKMIEEMMKQSGKVLSK